MTTGFLALALLAQAPAPAASAPAARPAPDTVRQARYERALGGVSDSLDVVRGAVAAFQLDLPSASPDLVLTRASRVRNSCHGAAAAVEQVSTVLAGGVYVPHARVEQGKLRSGTSDLRRTLARCEREWAVLNPPTRANADSLRAWGPYRGARLDAALRSYDGLLRAFMKQAALKKPAAS
ncbi:MAG TPA: hypothetical protein VKB45_13185 [Gemmatimonadales bacterium]|nr:hypothetical protein [Gemmatimonadales bacterium]